MKLNTEHSIFVWCSAFTRGNSCRDTVEYVAGRENHYSTLRGIFMQTIFYIYVQHDDAWLQFIGLSFASCLLPLIGNFDTIYSTFNASETRSVKQLSDAGCFGKNKLRLSKSFFVSQSYGASVELFSLEKPITWWIFDFMLLVFKINKGNTCGRWQRPWVV